MTLPNRAVCWDELDQAPAPCAIGLRMIGGWWRLLIYLKA